MRGFAATGTAEGRRRFASGWALAVVLILCFSLSGLAPARGQDGAPSASRTEGASGSQADNISIFVSILPQAAFLERIGGDRVAVEVLIGEGQSPHTYEPTPHQMAGLARARAFFGIGVAAERGVLRKMRQSHPHLAIVETQKGIPFRHLEGHHHAAGEPRHNSGHKIPDPHVWMSPRLVKIQARNMCDALARLDPAHRQTYAANLRAFEADLDRLDARLARVLAPLKGKKMYVFHPAFGYFADAYGLVQIPIEIEGKEPGPRQLAALISQARKDGVKVLFVQPQFSPKSAAAVARAIGGVVAPIDPLARDYAANMERLASAVEEGLNR